MKACCVILLVLLGVNIAWGHVSLTFPPARKLPLDFLNTFWTKQPCGMPKGSARTSLIAGQPTNITWHLGYAHQGGYRIELLDQNENKLVDLTPAGEESFYQGHNTAQWHYVTVPNNVTCRGCTVRLLRQVPEFSPNFQFISCADVDIVQQHSYVETCSGRGYSSNGQCTCNSRFWGDRCQYQDECDSDFDCNTGRCIYLGGSALPRKQCFCPETHFGPRCFSRNPSTLPRPNRIDLKKHVRVKLDERFTMLFKILVGPSHSQDEIEFVLQINGTSYGGLGWRPSQISPVCKSWPFYPNANRATSHHRIAKRDSTFTITKSIDETPAFPSSSGRSRSRLSPSSTQTSSVSASINVGAGRVVGNSQGRSVSTASRYQVFDTTRPSSSAPKNLFQSDVQVFELGTNSAQNEANVVRNIPTISIQPGRVPIPRLIHASRTSTRPPPTTTTTSPPFQDISSHDSSISEWAPKDPFTPMDCSDIVTGSARGAYHRFIDGYSRGRHTPLPDSIWGGRDDLLGAVGWEENGVTTLAFRRRMDSNDGPDHSIRGDMQIIWARGQEPGEPVSIPQHQLVPGNPTVSDFYTRDELKYHGLGSQRGSLFIDFDAVRNEYLNGRFSQ